MVVVSQGVVSLGFVWLCVAYLGLYSIFLGMGVVSLVAVCIGGVWLGVKLLGVLLVGVV